MNSVKVVRLAQKLMKKEVLAQSAGILTAHRLNQIESGKGWRPRPHEKSVLSQILGLPEKELFPEVAI